MRSRNIKPQFFKNEELSDCSFEARLLFIGLWCLADRKGRFEYRPKRIKIEILPYDDVDIKNIMQELVMQKLVLLYDVEGVNYGCIPTFCKHQNPHVKEQESTIPAPDMHSASTNLDSAEHDTSRADSLLLIPDMLNTEYISPNAPPESGGDVSLPAHFERFWSAYPKKVGKQAALNAWKKSKTKPRIEIILEAIEKQKEGVQWLQDGGRYIQNPATWINQGRWDDEVENQEPKKKSWY